MLQKTIIIKISIVNFGLIELLFRKIKKVKWLNQVRLNG
jgi:hypothetical protein